MKIIFIGGSKTIKALPRGAMEFLDAKLSEGDVRFIVGDSFGVDRAAQIFLASKGADIKVYASEGRVRNNPCDLPVVAVPAEGFRGRDFYRQKDIAMACEATEGLMIWDGKARVPIWTPTTCSRSESPLPCFCGGGRRQYDF